MRSRRLICLLMIGILALSAASCSTGVNETTSEQTAVASTDMFSSDETETNVTVPVVSEEIYDLTKYIKVTDGGFGQRFYIPQIESDSQEIINLNKQIIEDAKENEYTDIDFELYSARDGLISIVINYNYDGWGGQYKVYTIDLAGGHVLTNSEIIEQSGINIDDFTKIAREGTLNYLNSNYSDENNQVVIDGKINEDLDETFKQYVADNLSDKTLSADKMIMFIDSEGNLCIMQSFFAIADPHDCERFYQAANGEEPQLAVTAFWRK